MLKSNYIKATLRVMAAAVFCAGLSVTGLSAQNLLTGQVVDFDSEEPLAGATVVISGGGTR